jgi:hypothetical protein
VLARYEAEPKAERVWLASALAEVRAEDDPGLAAAALAVTELAGWASKHAVGVTALQGVQVGDHNTQINIVPDRLLMPLAAAARDPEAVFAAAGLKEFTGREWLVAEVDAFVAEKPCGYVFIEAKAGLGKTAFAAWMVKTCGYLSHFSRYAGGGSVAAALGNLSAQLIIRFGLDDLAPDGMWLRARHHPSLQPAKSSMTHDTRSPRRCAQPASLAFRNESEMPCSGAENTALTIRVTK